MRAHLRLLVVQKVHPTAGSKPGLAMCLCTWGFDKTDHVSLSLHHSMHTTICQTNKADSAYLISARSQNLHQLYNQLTSPLMAVKQPADTQGHADPHSGCYAAVGRLFSCQTRSPTCGRCQEASVGRRHRQRCRRCHPSSHLQAGRHNSLPGQRGQECGGGVQGGA